MIFEGQAVGLPSGLMMPSAADKVAATSGVWRCPVPGEAVVLVPARTAIGRLHATKGACRGHVSGTFSPAQLISPRNLLTLEGPVQQDQNAWLQLLRVRSHARRSGA